MKLFDGLINAIKLAIVFWAGVFLIIFSCTMARAGSLELYGSVGSNNGSYFPGGKLIAAMDEGLYGNPYLFGSYSRDRFVYDLAGPDFGYYGLGFGYRYPLWKSNRLTLSLYGEIGFYIPDMNYRDESGPMAACNNEALYQLLNDKYPTHKQYDPNTWHKNLWFDIYELDMDPAFGAEVGAHGKYRTTEWLDIVGSVGYLRLEFPYYAAGKWNDVEGAWIEYFSNGKDNLDASRWTAYLGISYQF